MDGEGDTRLRKTERRQLFFGPDSRLQTKNSLEGQDWGRAP